MSRAWPTAERRPKPEAKLLPVVHPEGLPGKLRAGVRRGDKPVAKAAQRVAVSAVAPLEVRREVLQADRGEPPKAARPPGAPP